MKKSRIAILTSIFTLIFLISNIPLKSYIKSLTNKEIPQLVLVLGGDIKREYIGASLAKILGIPLIISGGSNPEYAKWSIEKIGLDNSQFILDYRAKDTFSNFTSLVDDLSSQGISHTLLITSENHMQRASNIGKIIAGSKGIKLTNLGIACKPECQIESNAKQIVDIFRSIVWVITKKDLKDYKLKNEYINKRDF